MRSSLTEADLSPQQKGKATREHSIELTAEETLNRLRGLESKPGRVTKAKTTGHMSHMEKMSQSMNFLNLDRRSMTAFHAAPQKTVGGDNPREALMKLRIKRLSKKPTPQTATERLYQSDSALFGGTQAPHSKSNARDAVWFKSSYPTRQTLEKLDEAEQEYDESTHRSSVGEDDIYGDMPELDDFANTSSTDLWLHGNQSAPGDFQRRPNAAYLNDEDDDEEEEDTERGDHVDDDMKGASGRSGTSSSKGNRSEMTDESIQMV